MFLVEVVIPVYKVVDCDGNVRDIDSKGEQVNHKHDAKHLYQSHLLSIIYMLRVLLFRACSLYSDG